MPVKIAILIDAENVDPSHAQRIFSYARSLGEVTVREIYGAGIALNEWADPILENTIHPNFTLRPNRFKNSSDIALTIGAMEILHASLRGDEQSHVDAVIIASSDSDFSPLAFHLRAAGVDVIGMGEPGRVNPMWPKACTEFIELVGSDPLVRKRGNVELPEAPKPAPEETAPAPKPAPALLPPEEEAPAPAPAPVPAPAPAAAPKEEKPAPIARSHRARLEIIRQFIVDQLDSHDGRIKSGELFKALAALPDYKFDQKRSRRKPLDYLSSQFGSWFRLEPGENGSYWIFLQPKAAPVPEEESPAEENAAPELPPEQEASPEETPKEEAMENAIGVQDLIFAGIPPERAETVLSILQESDNRFIVFNALTQTFGRKDGKKYYAVIKEWGSKAPALQEKAEQEEETEEFPADDEAPQAEGAEEEAFSEPIAPSPLEQFLTEHGLPMEAASQTAAIVNESPNMRVAYNSLRKAFGGQGRDYFTLVKQFNGQAAE